MVAMAEYDPISTKRATKGKFNELRRQLEYIRNEDLNEDDVVAWLLEYAPKPEHVEDVGTGGDGE